MFCNCMNFEVNVVVISKAIFESYQFCVSGVLVKEIFQVDSTSHKTVITFDKVKVAVRVITRDGAVYFLAMKD
jgi:hypothetical protein